MSKFTPGAWVAALDHNSRPIVWGPGTWQIADGWHTPDGNGWANARLIAAAPDLLEALRIAVIALAGAAKSDAAYESAYQAVSAAIAKATGAGHE